jgi:hypothetical protein
MTEEAWRSEGGLYPMMQFLRERARQRKVLLFNCACCRRVWTFLSDGDRRAVVEFEMIADDPVVIAELEGRYQPPPQYHTLHTDGGIAVYPAFDEPTAPQSGTKLRTMLAVHRGWSISGVAHAASNLAAGEPQVGRPLPRTAAERNEELARRILAEPLGARETTEQTRLLRDIFGNPFRPSRSRPTGTRPRPSRWRIRCTSRVIFPRCRSSPMRSRTPGATAAMCSITAAGRGRTSAGARSLICCWGRSDLPPPVELS